MKEGHYFRVKPIGVIHSPYKNRAEAPYRGCGSKRISLIEVFEEFEEGLQDIERFSHIVVVYWFHKCQGYRLLVKTPRDGDPHGLFSTRSPNRPCPLGLTVVELITRRKNVLKVKGLDAIDGTPLLDVKPCIPEVERRPTAKTGYLKAKTGKERC